MRVRCHRSVRRTGRAPSSHARRRSRRCLGRRSPSSAPQGTTVAQADARDHEALAAGVKGADAVVVVYRTCRQRPGSGDAAGRATALVAADGVGRSVRAWSPVGCGRLSSPAKPPVVALTSPSPFSGRVLRANNEDTRAMETVIRASDTSWTLLRPSRLIAGDGEPDIAAVSTSACGGTTTRRSTPLDAPPSMPSASPTGRTCRLHYR